MSCAICENCKNSIKDNDATCPNCAFPQHGTKADKITYNGNLLKLKDLLEDSDKSVKAMISFSIIFAFASIIVLVFSLLFHESHYELVVLFLVVAAMYFLLYKLGLKSTYRMASLALVFYLLHTIFEFSQGMYLKSPVDLSQSFSEGMGPAIIFALVPFAYLVFRLVLIFVLAKYLWIQVKMKKYDKQIQFLRDTKKS